MLKTWQLTGEQKYLDYAASWVHAVFDESGKVKQYKRADLDDIQAGILLYTLYDATGDEFYRRCIESVAAQVQDIPRCQCGGFWHTCGSSNQMWLDGIYMGSPFYAEYAFRNNRPEDYQDVIRQFVVCARHTYDPATGLYRHAWDEARKQPWADKKTGQSPHTWGRAMGWYAMALVDALEFIPKHEPGREEVMDILDNVVTQIARWQDKESGLWYQVIDQPEREGNFPEASVTTQCMYAIAKAVNKGYIDPKYRAVAEKAFNGLKEKLLRENPDGTLTLTRCCQVGGLGGRPYRDGSYGYYIGEKIRDNDAKATGPYIMGCLELGQTD